MSGSSSNRPSNAIQAHADEIDLRHLIGMLLDGRYIIGVVTALALMLAFVYVIFAEPIYKANGVIQVEDNSPGVPGLSDMAEIFAAESSSATELHVIKSRLVLGRVVDELGLTVEVKPVYTPIFGALFARGVVPYQTSTVPLGMDGYASGGEVIKVAELSLPRYLVSQDLRLVVEGEDSFSLWNKDNKLLSGVVGGLISSDDGLVNIRVDELYALQGVEFIITKSGRLSKILDLQKAVRVSEKGKDTGIIEISLEGPDRNLIANIVDSVSANYYLQNVQRMAEEAENSLNFLDDQIPRIKDALISSEEALNNYRSEKTSVDLSLEAQVALDGLVQIEAEISTMSINEADISRKFTPQHPNYISFKRQQDSLFNQREKLARKLEALPDTQKTILRLKRDFEVNQAIFLALQNKRQELSILKASTVGNVRILDEAEIMPEAVAPRKGLILVLSVLFGGILGVMIVSLRNFLKSGITDPKVFSDNGFMVHATIPHSEEEDSYSEAQQLIKRYKTRKKQQNVNRLSLLAHEHPADLTVEALRSLRTSLHFSMLDAKNNVVMMSSASPGVGKSFVSANLGAVIAQGGKRVLVVDSDMRKGYMHKRFGVKPDDGMSEILASTLDFKKAVKGTLVEGLDIITRGKIPTNPSELLMGSNFSKLISELQPEYDLIIFDTPPILAVTDASIIGSYCGTSLLVSRFESCTLREITTANHRFELAGVEIKGIVFNAVQKKSSAYYYDYGYYNYEYKSDS